MKAITTLPSSKTDQDRVPLDKDGELSQLLGLARSNQDDGVG